MTTTPCTGCAVQQGTHQPADALHQIAEPKTQQPEALRLAESYEATGLRGHLVVAAELRSQHARIVELEAQIAAAQQAVQSAAPLPLLLRDVARDLGITVPQACIALKPLGNYSTNSAVTAEMARMLRDHFPAPAHPAEAVQPFGWLITKSKLPGDVEFTQDPVRENLARSFGYQTQALYTHPTQQGMEKDAARWRMAVLISRETMTHPDKRTAADAVAAYMHAVHSGMDIQGAIDAALAAQAKQGGK